MTHNPCSHIGELLKRVGSSMSEGVEEAEAWNREEVETLISVAREHQPRFAPILVFLLSTGCRRGEALGLEWRDVNLAERKISIRRSLTQLGLSTPKNRRGRVIGMSDGLHTELTALLEERRREQFKYGWRAIPEPVFCSSASTRTDPRNAIRAWEIVRRRAAAKGVRPLKLHCARHTFATLALAAGRNIRWVASALGHADPSLTLRCYSHAMPNEDGDLDFASFGVPGPGVDTPKRPLPLRGVLAEPRKSP